MTNHTNRFWPLALAVASLLAMACVCSNFVTTATMIAEADATGEAAGAQAALDDTSTPEPAESGDQETDSEETGDEETRSLDDLTFSMTGALTRGEAMTATLGAGEVHRWNFTASAGDFLNVAVTSFDPNFDVVISVYGPDGALIRRADESMMGASEVMVVNATEDGEYAIVVEEFSGAGGEYSIIVPE